ncbi:hypothetical protein FA13DRAFT_601858 [Coprinellus micaceus]|uniref:Uncharacterized protein n=1 Tax=Coprinellus micaceus TaxID=71717 RepID=A0A4Y7T7I3_COPMI|nr:hypothetical protein FA13DRAFT_601858 [Coprinellus micaceus]
MESNLISSREVPLRPSCRAWALGNIVSPSCLVYSTRHDTFERPLIAAQAPASLEATSYILGLRLYIRIEARLGSNSRWAQAFFHLTGNGLTQREGQKPLGFAPGAGTEGSLEAQARSRDQQHESWIFLGSTPGAAIERSRAALSPSPFSTHSHPTRLPYQEPGWALQSRVG